MWLLGNWKLHLWLAFSGSQHKLVVCLTGSGISFLLSGPLTLALSPFCSYLVTPPSCSQLEPWLVDMFPGLNYKGSSLAGQRERLRPYIPGTVWVGLSLPLPKTLFADIGFIMQLGCWYWGVQGGHWASGRRRDMASTWWVSCWSPGPQVPAADPKPQGQCGSV